MGQGPRVVGSRGGVSWRERLLGLELSRESAGEMGLGSEMEIQEGLLRMTKSGGPWEQVAEGT